MPARARTLSQDDVRTDIFNSLCMGLLKDGTGVRFRATGASMWPYVRDGDVIEIERVDFAGLRVGDIACTGNRTSRILVHRVVKKIDKGDKRAVVTQGDALRYADQAINADRLLGRVSKVFHAGRLIDLKRPFTRFKGYSIARLNYSVPGTYQFLRRIAAKTGLSMPQRAS